MKRLFNPFEKYTERQLLLFGTLAALVGGVVAWLCNARFDGALDLHFTAEVTPLQTITDFLSRVGSLLLFLWIASRFVNRKTRLIDLLSTIIIAHIPYYILPPFNCTGTIYGIGERLKEGMNAAQQLNWMPGAGELVLLIVFGLLTILMTVWSVALLFNGYRVATNAKGAKPVVLFIAALLFAEIVSLIVVYYLNLYAFK